jgi:hypothetical protein
VPRVICPTPVVVVDTQCTVPPGTVITVTPAGAIGPNASGQITGDGITVNLAAANTMGALAQTGSLVTLQSTSTVAANANNQTGGVITRGLTLQVRRLTSLYASYQLGVEGDSDAWDAKTGLRANW